MARLTLIRSFTTNEQLRCDALDELKLHILFMIEFYHRTRGELGLPLDPDIPRSMTPLAEYARGDQG